MPKRVDHGRRRARIVRAVWELASTEGLEAVTVRRVAAQAELSSPLVQRHFPDKDTMLQVAMAELAAAADRRARDRLAAAGTEPGPEHLPSLIRAVLAEFLPLDPERRLTLLVHVAYFNRALDDDRLAAVYRDPTPASLHLIEQLREARSAGSVGPAVDPEREVDSLIALATGLGTELLMGIRTPEQALELVDYHLVRLFGPEAASGGERNRWR